MKKQPVLERVTEAHAVSYAIERRCIHYKLNGLGKMGKPDREFVTPNGYNWYVEFKREGEKPTKLQFMEAERLTNRHQLHSFIWTFEEFKFKLDWLLKLPKRTAPSGW